MTLRFFTLQSKSGGGNGFLTPGAPGQPEPALRQQPRATAAQDELFQHWIVTDGNAFLSFDDVVTPSDEPKFKKAFRVMNRATGRVVDAVGGDPLHDNQNLQIYKDFDGVNQRWGMFATGVYPGAVIFRAVEVDEYGLAWSVPNGSGEPGVQIRLDYLQDIDNLQNNPAQLQWYAEEVEWVNNPVLIRSVLDQTVLDVPGFSLKAGERIQHFGKNTGLNQIWRLDEVADGRYLIRSLSSDLVLDVPADANNPPGQTTNIQQFHSNFGDNQHWRLVNAGGNRVKIESVYSPGLVLDVKVGDGADAFVQVYPSHDADNQKWELVPGYWDEFALPFDKFKISDP